MQRKYIQQTAIITQTVGINISNQHRRSDNIYKFILSFTAYLSLDVVLLMTSISHRNDFYQFVTPIPYIAASAVVQGGIYFMHRYSETITKMIDEMDRNFYKYPDENLIEIEYPWYLQEKNITLFVTIAKYASLSVLFTLFLPVLGETLYYGRITTFIYPVWTPWKLDNLKSDLIVSAVQLLQGFCALWFNYVFIAFLLVTVTELARQYQRLTTAISSLERRTLEKCTKQGCFNCKLKENILHCIRHHQILCRNFHIFETWFSILFSIELTVAGVTFTFAVYMAMNAVQAQNMSEILNYFTLVFFIWVNFLIRCLIGEIFSQLNDTLAKTVLWETPWCMANKENRKLLLLFHSSISKPLCLYGLSIFEANRVTFGSLVRKTSVFIVSTFSRIFNEYLNPHKYSNNNSKKDGNTKNYFKGFKINELGSSL